MASDTVYRVRTIYTVESATAQANLRSLGATATGLDRLFARAGRSASSSFSTIGGAVRGLLGPLAAVGSMAAAGAGFGALVRSGMQFNDQLEQARMGLGAMMIANGTFSSMTGALGMSARLVEEMRQDADRLPGSFEELLTIVRGSLNSALGAGIDPEHFRRTAGRLLGVSHILGVSAPVAGREMAAMIEGHATRANVLFSRMSAIIGMSAREFNQLTGPERFARIEAALKRFDPAMEAYSHSWDAVASTARDHLRTLQQSLTAPIFDAVRGRLERFNHWFENKDRRQSLIDWATHLGQRLADGLNRGVDAALRLSQVFSRGGLAAIFERLRTAGSLMGLMRLGLGAAGGSMGGALGGFVAGRLLAGLATGAIDASRLLEALGRTASESSGAFARLNASLGPAIDRLLQFGIDGTTELVNSFNTVATSAGSLAVALAGYANEIGTIISTARMSFLGDHPEAERAYNNAITGQNIPGLLADMGIGAGVSTIPYIGQIAGPMVTQLLQMRRNSADARRRAENHTHSNGGDDLIPLAFASSSDLAAARPEKQRRQRDRAGPSGTTHYTVRIEQTIHDASDPDRVLIDTHRAIRQALQFPIESPTSTSPSLR